MNEVEANDRIQILKYVFVTLENEPEMIENVIQKHPSPSTTTFCLPIVPPKRCSDGVRRGLRDYVDYLFQTPNIDDLIEEANAKRTLYKVELQFLNVDIGQVVITH